VSGPLSDADVPAQLPVLPLGEVLLPGATLVVQLDQANGVAVDRARNGLLVACAQRRPATKGLTAEDVHEVGTLARVISDGPGSSPRQVTLLGLARCRVRADPKSDPRLGDAVVMLLHDEPDPDCTERVQRIRGRLNEVLAYRPVPGAAERLAETGEPGRLADAIAGVLPLPLSVKQQLLEATQVRYRLSLVEAILNGMQLASPEPGTEDGVCAAHRAPAKSTCARCGAFVCDLCKSLRFDPELCPACEQRDGEAKARKKQAEEALGAPLWMVEFLGIFGLAIGILLTARRIDMDLWAYLGWATVGLLSAGSARYLARKSRQTMFSAPGLSWLAIGLNAYQWVTLARDALAALAATS
jgi:Lon protease-like protein